MKTPFILIGMVLVLAASVYAALNIGPVPLTPEILWNLRLPRVLLALVIGMALATAGTIFQGILRNPLADPFILGTSSGASIGVLGANLLGWNSSFGLYALALLCALASVFVVRRIALTDGRAPVQTLILAGVVVSTFLNAIVFLAVSLFFKEAFSTLFFLLGTLTETNLLLLKISSGLILGALPFIWFLGSRLNVLSQGDETSLHLGVDPEKNRRILFFLASLLVAAAVAASGMIGFIGLLVPHILRLLLGPDHRTLIPASAIGGAILLVWMDAGARTLAAPVEIPVGVLSAICGTPFLIYLLRRKKGDVF